MPGKETHTTSCHIHVLGRRLGRGPPHNNAPSPAVWAAGGSSERRGATPSRPRWPQRHPSCEPGPRDTTSSPTPVTGSGAVRDQHPPRSWVPSSRRLGLGMRGGRLRRVRGAARRHRPWPDSCGQLQCPCVPLQCPCVSSRPVPPRGLARQPPTPGRRHLTHAVIRFLSPVCGRLFLVL